MSKQDAVVPGLRVHLHQQGFVRGFRGVLILTGLKQYQERVFGSFGGVLEVGWSRQFRRPAYFTFHHLY